MPRDQQNRRRQCYAQDSKRLVVACDGTWLNSNNTTDPGLDNIPSNVSRLYRAIRPVTAGGIQQIRSYLAGVGTSGGRIERIWSGATGDGLGEDVREGYNFLTSNWIRGDDIFLIGFSRGAFTARAIAGLIGDLGILTAAGMRYFPQIYADVHHQHDPDYISADPHVPFRYKPSFKDPRYLQRLVDLGLTRVDVPIKALGVWDTVGSLGTPRLGWWAKVGLQSPATNEMSFYDTRLSNCIESAFQALALDERRAAFSPTLWEKPPGNRTKLRQVWFPGVHSNVGGGLEDQELANITLAWMMACLEPYLEFNKQALFTEQTLADNYYMSTGQKRRPWASGEIENSSTGVYALAGSADRTPGAYRVTDPQTGRDTHIPLRNTCEYIHPSVRVRTLDGGPGTDDRGRYDSVALRNREMVWIRGREPQDAKTLMWRYEPEGPYDDTVRDIPECPLLGLEREFLARSRDPAVKNLALHPDLGIRRNTVQARRLRGRACYDSREI